MDDAPILIGILCCATCVLAIVSLHALDDGTKPIEQKHAERLHFLRNWASRRIELAKLDAAISSKLETMIADAIIENARLRSEAIKRHAPPRRCEGEGGPRSN